MPASAQTYQGPWRGLVCVCAVGVLWPRQVCVLSWFARLAPNGGIRALAARGDAEAQEPFSHASCALGLAGLCLTVSPATPGHGSRTTVSRIECSSDQPAPLRSRLHIPPWQSADARSDVTARGDGLSGQPFVAG